jgi:hypothetical protein
MQGIGPLSRDSQDKGFQRLVNKKSASFIIFAVPPARLQLAERL